MLHGLNKKRHAKKIKKKIVDILLLLLLNLFREGAHMGKIGLEKR